MAGQDLTPYMSVAIQLALATLEELVAQVQRANRRDEDVRELLQENALLNHRKRLILARALRNPDAEFRIGYHKTNHGVTYATARSDFVQLAREGYMLCEKQGRAFVYKGAPNLRDLVSSSQEDENLV